MDASKDFLVAAQQSGLLAAEQVADLTRDGVSAALTAEGLAGRLVDEQKLTAFQAEQLLAGRGEACVLAGRYQLLERLGAGGMGEVFKARDSKLDRFVAVKIMAPHLVSQTEALARFRREAKALAKVSHPGIVQAFDTDEDRGRQFLVMEYVEGRSLVQLVHEKGRVIPALAADYIYQAALALHHAHERGLIHRDIKPANLLLAARRQIKILDLGLAHFVQDHVGDAGLTREGAGMGTPDYMAPEQFTNARLADARCDVYALGCTLHHLLTGHVPFPGTSLSEKAAAHESQEPPRIEDLCPEAPVGLALAARKMMAKRPADRFQSMLEVAEALTPHVAGSSLAVPQIQATSSWQGSQLSFVLQRDKTQTQPRRKRWLLVAGGVAAALALTAAAVVFLPGWLTPEETPPANNNGAAPEAAAPTHDPNVLTVSKDPKDKAQFDTINGALEKVKPGQTIRVLDNSTYRGPLLFGDSARHAGVTLIASKKATLEFDGVPVGVDIRDVSDVTVIGFRVVGQGSAATLIRVSGKSPGVGLHYLEFHTDWSASQAIPLKACVELSGLDLDESDGPVMVTDCRFGNSAQGVRVSGLADYRTPRPSRRVIVRDNELFGCNYGIYVLGLVQQLQITGNRIYSADRSTGFLAMQFENLMDGTRDLLVANNTVWQTKYGVRIWDDQPGGTNIEFRNNLLLAGDTLDMLFVGSGAAVDPTMPPGDIEALLKQWRFDHNWRESLPPGDEKLKRLWVPPAVDDVRQDRIDGIDRDSATVTHLRPAKDSPLATQGAGQTDPRLPSYVGAVPPEGVPPWDWDRTWHMPKDAQLLTVSKDPKDKAQFSTINDALKAAKPWATIRVLDGADYAEPIALDDAGKHAGITLEAPKRGVIQMASQSNRALSIRGVADVRVSGFRFAHPGVAQSGTFILLDSSAPGVVLEDLDLQSGGDLFAIILQDLQPIPGGAATIIRKCTIRGGYNGIVIVGKNRSCGGVLLQDNQVLKVNGSGVLLRGAIGTAWITGNVMSNCRLAGLEIMDLAAGNERVAFLNNTIISSGYACRIADLQPYGEIREGQVEFRNNLFCEAQWADLTYAVEKQGGAVSSKEHNDKATKLWIFGHNWRDLSGSDEVMPLVDSDKQLQAPQFNSRDPMSPDFLRPTSDSPLATGGAGKDDPTLPIYVGAVPPKGTPAWDWDKTWRWRIRRAAPPN